MRLRTALGWLMMVALVAACSDKSTKPAAAGATDAATSANRHADAAVADASSAAAAKDAALADAASAQSARAYQGTAAVGDFVTLSVDATAKQISYENHTNGLAGTVSYSVEADGSYKIDDPAGNLRMAYELPGFGMALAADKSGPNADTPALVLCLNSAAITSASLADHKYNYIQLKTQWGGLEPGAAIADTTSLRIEFYSPLAAYTHSGDMFHPLDAAGHGLPLSSFTAHGDYLSWQLNDPSKPEDNGKTFYLFGTPGGFLAIDTPNGALVMLQETASKDFDPSTAGTYNAILYRKQSAQEISADGGASVENGDASLGRAAVVVDASGKLTLRDEAGTILAAGTLTPVADTELFGAGKLSDGEHGLFRFQTTLGGEPLEVFAAFLDRGIVFGGFAAHSTSTSGPPIYDYFHGFALKR